jgi:xylan 1,4-beta-xylosidase
LVFPPNYAVGYATSTSPMGPWTKYKDNPVLSASPNLKGTGHCAFVRAPNEELYMVYHAHKNVSTVLPRKMCFDPCEFLPDPDSEKPDIVKVYQTETWTEVFW